MNAEVIKSWLVKKKRWGFAQHVLLSLLALAAGRVVLFVTFWVTYVVIWLGSTGVSAVLELICGRKFHLAHEWRLAGSAVFLVLLFRQHFRTNPWHWGDYPVRDYRPSAALVASRLGAVGGLGVMLAYPGASANMLADILLSGPRLVSGAYTLVRQAMRWRRLDDAGCGVLLAFLLSRPEAVPWEELKSAGWEEWCGQLRCIEGVQFLEKGLMLSGELRRELNCLNRG